MTLIWTPLIRVLLLVLVPATVLAQTRPLALDDYLSIRRDTAFDAPRTRSIASDATGCGYEKHLLGKDVDPLYEVVNSKTRPPTPDKGRAMPDPRPPD